MSKIQASLEKAKQSRRDSANAQAGIAKGSLATGARSANAIPGSLFRLFRRTRPDRDIMEESHIVTAIDDGVAIAAYNLLRTRVAQEMRRNSWRSLLITSPGAGDGKTLTASNLAVSLSRDVNQSVLLVDLDLRRSTVAKYLGFNLSVDKGIGDFLTDESSISDIVYVPDDMERIAIVPNREPIDNPSDLLRGPKMAELLEWVQHQAEQSLVIFDMPPVLACDDVLAFAPAVDAVLLVVAEGQTDRRSLEKAASLLSESNLLGVVLNKSCENAGIADYGY